MLICKGQRVRAIQLISETENDYESVKKQNNEYVNYDMVNSTLDKNKFGNVTELK